MKSLLSIIQNLLFSIPIASKINQHTLCITTQCSFKCSFCNLWKETQSSIKLTENTLTELPQKKNIHLYGGDPLEHPDLLKLLIELKNQNKTIHFWTNANATIDTLDTISPFIERFYIFLPAPLKEEYRIASGLDYFNNLESNITHLIHQKKKITIAYHITPENVHLLPEAYEFAYYKGLPFVINYNPKASFTGDSIAYIKRFKKIKNCKVYKANPAHCKAFPLKRS